MPDQRERNHKNEFESVMRLNVSLMVVGAMWPPTHGGACARVLYLWYAGLALLVQLLVIVGQLRALHEHWGDLSKVTLIAGPLASLVMSAFKLLSILPRHPAMRALVSDADALVAKQLLRPDDPATAALLRASATDARLKSAAMMGATFASACVWNVYPMTQKALGYADELFFPAIVSFPFPVDYSPLFEAVYLLQVFALFACTVIIISADMFFLSIMMHIKAQLQILQVRLQRLGRSGGHQDVGDTSDSEGEREIEKRRRKLRGKDDGVEKVLRKCIKQHQRIIRFFYNSERILNVIILPQFLINVLILCLTLFQSLEPTENKVVMVNCFMYLVGVVFQALLYCWYSHGVLEESERVSVAAAEADWVNASPKVKRSLQILMCRAQRPMAFTAGKFYPISRRTFVKLINASYSYYAVLSRLNND